MAILAIFGIICCTVLAIAFLNRLSTNRLEVNKLKLKFGVGELELSPPTGYPAATAGQAEKYSKHLRDLLQNETYKPTRTYLKQTFSDLGSPEGALLSVINLAAMLSEPRTVRLLILGQAGAGKSMAIHYLAHRVLSADKDQKVIPVIFQASAWSKGFPSFRQFLIEQLQELYKIAPSIASALIESEQMVLFIDGVDEVPISKRGSFAEELSSFIKSHGLTSIVCCGREEVLNCLNKSDFTRVMLVNSLSVGSISAYLASEGRSQLVGPILGDSKLQELAKVPFYLYLMTTAMQHLNLEELCKLSTEDKQDLFTREFLRTQLQKVSNTGADCESATRYLRFIASSLAQAECTELVLESLQPEWLPHFWQRVTYFLLSVFCVAIATLPMISLVALKVLCDGKQMPASFVAGTAIAVGVLVIMCCYHVRPFGSVEFSIAKLGLPYWKRLLTGSLSWMIATIAVCFASLASLVVPSAILDLQGPDETWAPVVLLTALLFWGGVWSYFVRLLQWAGFSELFFALTCPGLVMLIVSASAFGWAVLSDSNNVDEKLIVGAVIGGIIFWPLALFKVLLKRSKLERIRDAVIWGSFCGLVFFGSLIAIFLLGEFGTETVQGSSALDNFMAGDIAMFPALWAEVQKELRPFPKELMIIKNGIVDVALGVMSVWSVAHSVQSMRGTDSWVRSIPNEGILRSVRNSFYCSVLGMLSVIFIGAVFSLVASVIEIVLPGLIPPSQSVQGLFKLICLFAEGVTVGLIASLLPVFQHFVIRALLWRGGLIPADLVAFLDRCVEARILMRTAGNYRFSHSILSDYFRNNQSFECINVTSAHG